MKKEIFIIFIIFVFAPHCRCESVTESLDLLQNCCEPIKRIFYFQRLSTKFRLLNLSMPKFGAKSLKIKSLACSTRINSARGLLKKIPQKDQELLTYLFKRLLFQEDFAYCLWGTKPISIDDGVYRLAFWKTFPLPEISDNGELCYYNHAVSVWNKYKHLFQLKNFILLDAEQDLFPCSIGIALINKKECKRVINNNLELFKRLLGGKVTADGLLEEIEMNKKSLKSALSYHEVLLGILLGYGKNNALLFNEKMTLFRILERPISAHFIYDHHFIRTKYEKLNRLACFHAFDETPSLINPLYFAADISHPETLALQKKYQKEREEITQIYAKGNFLEITLERLTNAESL